MYRFARLLVCTAAALSVCGVAVFGVCGSAAVAQDAPPGDAANGKRVYLATGCFTCHGRVGQGGAYNGPAPALAKTAMPFEGFKMQIRNPANDMPAYSEPVMSDGQIADIYAFVQALAGRRNAKDITILND
jgi:mono/diheme cytochrome c family protein